jgi:RNA polymerase sigma-70 factor (ECF subfamily)
MDELYIKRVLNGDTDAFRYFVQQYSERAYHMALSILKNEFTARDALQESYLIAFNKLDTYVGKAKFSTWFFRIVINESLKMMKREGAERDWNKASAEAVSESLPQALDLLDEDQQKYYIHMALKEIGPKEALALNLFYLQENSLAEVCEVTGWSLANSKVILYRARRRMYMELDRILKSEKKLLY